MPAGPAPAPPAPANLSASPGAAQPPPAAPEARSFTLPPGMEALPQGAWRLRFAPGTEMPPHAAEAALAELGRRLAAGPDGRVVLTAQASGPADVSSARRVSLARGLAVKEALVAGGLPAPASTSAPWAGRRRRRTWSMSSRPARRPPDPPPNHPPNHRPLGPRPVTRRRSPGR